MKRAVFALVAFSCACAATAAGVYTWTGAAGDDKWTTAGNWSPNGVPGWYEDDGEVKGDGLDTAVFGSDSRGREAVTIDLAGQKVVKSVFVEAGAPSYTFGLDSTYAQGLGINTNGAIRIAAGVTRDQFFSSVNINPHGSAKSYTGFTNLSETAVFTFGDLNSILAAGKGGYAEGYAALHLRGNGAFTMKGACKFDQCGVLGIYSTGKVRWSDGSSTGARYSGIYFYGDNGQPVDMELPEPTSCLRGNGGSFPWSNIFNAYSNARISGAGQINVAIPFNQPVERSNTSSFYIGSGLTLTVDCAIGNHPSWPAAQDLIVNGNTGGSLVLNGTNTLKGALRIIGDKKLVVSARLLGNAGCSPEMTSIPSGDIIFESDWSASVVTGSDGKKHLDSVTPKTVPLATLRYTGSEGATDRRIVVSNIYAAVNASRIPTNAFVNAGTGTFTLNGSVEQSPESKGASFRLGAETADLVFAGDFVEAEDRTWNLLVSGPKTVHLTKAQPISGFVSIEGGMLEMASFDSLASVSGYRLLGGGLSLTDQTGMARKPISAVSGLNTLELPASATPITLDVECASGAGIAFVAPAGTVIKVPNFPEGNLDNARFSLNGDLVKVTADGTLLSRRAEWRTAQDGDWSESAKWTPAAPLVTDTVRIEASGSSYTVTSGEVPLSEMQDIRLGNAAEGQTATLKITQDAGLTNTAVQIGAGGVLEVGTGNVLVVTNASNGATIDLLSNGVFRVETGATGVVANATSSRIRQQGGSYDVTGTLVGAWTFNVRDGGMVVHDGGLVTNISTGANWNFIPSSSDAEVHVSVEAGGHIAFPQGNIFMPRSPSGGRAVLDIEGSSATDRFNVSKSEIYGCAVGLQNGYGELNVRGGKVLFANYGLFVGCETISGGSADFNTKASCPTGVVNLTGGELSVYAYGWHYSAVISGCVIGNGLALPSSAAVRPLCRYDGTMNISGGTFKVPVGALVIGGGQAVGRLLQTGGTVQCDASNEWDGTKAVFPVVIGMEGGEGLYEISSGSFSSLKKMFVGGALKADLEYMNGPNSTYYPVVPKTAKGVFRMTGGTATIKGGLRVGADGEGRIELGGSANLTVDALVLSNSVSSTLAFTLPAGRTPGWTAKVGRLVFTDGAHVVVDGSAFAEKHLPVVKLLEADEIEGELDVKNVTILSTEANADAFRDAEILTSFGTAKGLWIKGRPVGTIVLFR